MSAGRLDDAGAPLPMLALWVIAESTNTRLSTKQLRVLELASYPSRILLEFFVRALI
jgi:hypothetical protein